MGVKGPGLTQVSFIFSDTQSGCLVGLGSNAFIQVFEEEEKDMKYAFCSTVSWNSYKKCSRIWVGW